MTNLVAADQPLTDAQARSLSPGYASVLQSLAGRVRVLCDLVQGAGAVANTAPAALPNPQGLIGVDFSGPPFGSAWKHTVFVRGGVQADVSGDAVGQKQVGTVDANNPIDEPISYHSRSFPIVDGTPYSRVYLAFRAFRVTGATFDLTISLTGSSGLTRSSTVSISSATESSFAPTDVFWDVTPGANDELRIRFDVAAAASSVTISCFCGYQRVKRGH